MGRIRAVAGRATATSAVLRSVADGARACLFRSDQSDGGWRRPSRKPVRLHYPAPGATSPAVAVTPAPAVTPTPMPVNAVTPQVMHQLHGAPSGSRSQRTISAIFAVWVISIPYEWLWAAYVLIGTARSRVALCGGMAFLPTGKAAAKAKLPFETALEKLEAALARCLTGGDGAANTPSPFPRSSASILSSASSEKTARHTTEEFCRTCSRRPARRARAASGPARELPQPLRPD